MHRASKSRWLIALFAPLGFLVTLEAHAGPPPPHRGGGLDGGGYIQLAPGVVGVALGQDDFRDDYRMTWTGAFGAGWMLSAGPFKATFGGAIEHHGLIFDRTSFRDFKGNSLNFLGEMRLGAGSNRVWGYGMVGLGPSLTLLDWNDPLYSGTQAFSGLDFQFGGGIQGMVARRFFLGGEIDFDNGFYFDADRRLDDDDFTYHTMTLKFLLGWYF